MKSAEILEILSKRGVAPDVASAAADEIMAIYKAEYEELEKGLEKIKSQLDTVRQIHEEQTELLLKQLASFPGRGTWVTTLWTSLLGLIAAGVTFLLSSKEISDFFNRVIPQIFSDLVPSLASTAWAADTVGASKLLPADIGVIVFVLIYILLAIILVVCTCASIFSKDPAVRQQSVDFSKNLVAFFIGVVSGKLG